MMKKKTTERKNTDEFISYANYAPDHTGMMEDTGGTSGDTNTLDLGMSYKSPEGGQPLLDDHNRTPPPPTPIPKWYYRKQRAKLKQELILKNLEEFSRPKTITYKEQNKEKNLVYQEDAKSIKNYENELKKLSIKELLLIGKVEELKELKYQGLEVLYKFNKKKRCIVTLIHKNKSMNDYIISQNTRFFNIQNGNYIRIPERGMLNTKYNLAQWFYYEGNPFPLSFSDDYTPIDASGNTIPDAQLLKKTMKFEYAEQLATSNLDKNVNLAMIFSILSAILGLLNTVLILIMMNNSGII